MFTRTTLSQTPAFDRFYREIKAAVKNQADPLFRDLVNVRGWCGLTLSTRNPSGMKVPQSAFW